MSQLNNKLNYIDNMNFDKLKERLVNEELNTIIDPIMDKDFAETIIYKYKLFLKLILLYPNKNLSPSIGIDIIWHYHILDTERYIQDCNYLYGKYIHHVPTYALSLQKPTNNDNTILNIKTMDNLFKKHFNLSIFTSYQDSVF